MYVCVQLPHTDRLLRFSIENYSKWLDYPAVVHRGTIPAFKDDPSIASRLGRVSLPWEHLHVGWQQQLRVGSKVYSKPIYKHGTCIGLWSNHAANVCWASIDWRTFHISYHLLDCYKRCSLSAKHSYSDELALRVDITRHPCLISIAPSTPCSNAFGIPTS